MNTAQRALHVRLALLLAAGCLAAGCDVTVGLGSDRYVEREKKDFPVSGVADITLATFDGSIEIRAWDRPEVSVEIEKRGPDKSAVDRIQVSATQSGNRVSIEVKNADEGHARIGFSVSRTARLIASVPRQANIDARSGDGSITIERVGGRVQLTTGDGSIRATELTGDLRAHTSDGSISLERIDGRVDADTGDGSIGLSGKLEAVRLKTGDGSVRLRADNGSRMTDDWDVRTSDGSIGLELPEPFDAALDARTGDGTVSVSSFTVKGDVSKESIRGEIGAGGKTLRVTSGDGAIRISRS